MTARYSRVVAGVLGSTLAVLAFGACGSSGGGSSEPTKTATNGAITVEAFDIHFDVGVIKATAGPLHVTFIDKGALQHTFKIENTEFELKADAGQTKTGTVTLQKGTYKFECTIPGHAQQGMKGTIEVS